MRLCRIGFSHRDTEAQRRVGERKANNHAWRTWRAWRENFSRKDRKDRQAFLTGLQDCNLEKNREITMGVLCDAACRRGGRGATRAFADGVAAVPPRS